MAKLVLSYIVSLKVAVSKNLLMVLSKDLWYLAYEGEATLRHTGSEA